MRRHAGTRPAWRRWISRRDILFARVGAGVADLSFGQPRRTDHLDLIIGSPSGQGACTAIAPRRGLGLGQPRSQIASRMLWTGRSLIVFIISIGSMTEALVEVTGVPARLV